MKRSLPHWKFSTLIVLGILWAALLLLQACNSTLQRNLAEHYYNIGTDYYNDKNYEQAVTYFALALKEAPNFQLVHFNYGLALIETKDYQAAEQQLTQAYNTNKRNTLSLSALGYLSFRAEDYEASASWYRKSIEANKFNPETYYNLGIVEQKLGDYEASQQAFDKIAEFQAATESPNELRYFAALNQLHFGKEEKAMLLYSEYFAERGNNEQVFQDVYNFYTEKQQYDSVIATFAIFEESMPNNPLASFLLARLYYEKLENPVLGLENLKQAISQRFRDEDRLGALVKRLRGASRKAAQQEIDNGKL